MPSFQELSTSLGGRCSSFYAKASPTIGTSWGRRRMRELDIDRDSGNGARHKLAAVGHAIVKNGGDEVDEHASMPLVSRDRSAGQ